METTREDDMAMRRKPAVAGQADRLVRGDARSGGRGNKYTGSDDSGRDGASLRTGQTREASEAWAGPGMPLMTDGQAKGFLFGALVGGLVGILVLLPFAAIPIGGFGLGARLLTFAVVGALAGGTAGVLYYGGRMPELEGEMTDSEGAPDHGSSDRPTEPGG